MSESLQALIQKYVAVVRDRAPLAARSFRKPASELDITSLAAEYDQEIPSALFPLFLIVNGQRSAKLALIPSADSRVPGYKLSTAEEMVLATSNAIGARYLFRGMPEFPLSISGDSEVSHEDWDEQKFVFAQWDNERTGSDARLFVDLAPTSTGKVGQVVAQFTQWKDMRARIDRRVIAPSVEAFFSTLIKNLEDGSVVFDEKLGLHFARAAGLPVPALSGAPEAGTANEPRPKPTKRRVRKGGVALRIRGGLVMFNKDPESELVCAKYDLPAWADFSSENSRPDLAGAEVFFVLQPQESDDPVVLASSSVYEHAIEWFLDNQSEVQQAALAALTGYVLRLRADDAIRDEELDSFEEASDLSSMVDPSFVRFHPHARDGIPYVGIELECNWDPEHGCGILLHGSRAVDVGTGEAAQATSTIEQDGGLV